MRRNNNFIFQNSRQFYISLFDLVFSNWVGFDKKQQFFLKILKGLKGPYIFSPQIWKTKNVQKVSVSINLECFPAFVYRFRIGICNSVSINISATFPTFQLTTKATNVYTKFGTQITYRVSNMAPASFKWNPTSSWSW